MRVTGKRTEIMDCPIGAAEHIRLALRGNVGRMIGRGDHEIEVRLTETEQCGRRVADTDLETLSSFAQVLRIPSFQSLKAHERQAYAILACLLDEHAKLRALAGHQKLSHCIAIDQVTHDLILRVWWPLELATVATV